MFSKLYTIGIQLVLKLFYVMKNITLKHFNISFLSNILTFIHFILQCESHFEKEVVQKTCADSGKCLVTY